MVCNKKKEDRVHLGQNNVGPDSEAGWIPFSWERALLYSSFYSASTLTLAKKKQNTAFRRVRKETYVYIPDPAHDE